MEVRPGYKQTEVGVIPKDWRPTALAQLSAFITKGSTPTTYGFKWEEAGILFLRSECVSERGLDLTQSMYISDAAHSMLRRSEVSDGDILLTITGNVGRAILLSGVGRGNINQHIARVRITSPKAVSQYVFHALSQTSSRRRFAAITTGQAYPQISLQQVREAEVPLPPTTIEQEAIAAVLSDADALIESLEQLLAKKRDLKQAAMQQLLTGKLRLPGFSGEWEVKQLGDVGSFSKGRGLAKDDLNPSGALPAIPYTAIYTDYGEVIDPSKIRHFVKSATGREVVSSPHLLIASSSNMLENIGKVTAFTGGTNVVVGGDILLYRTTADVCFLSYLLSTRPHRDRVVSLSQGSTIRHVYASTFRTYELALPPTAEQVAIATVLSDMDAELAALEQRRDKTCDLKQGMMQELLTGRIRLV